MLHGSSRTAKIAGVAALAGLMMTVAIVAAVRPDQPAPPPPAALPVEGGQARLARELDRCAILTMPDAGCEAVWAANRRRFFRQDERAPAEEPDGGVSPAAEGAAP
ncbi:putative entry exclusion protein TrbK-alt [Brevundimonas diminuta]|uniref:putative entry exclusion protein TrbK-alt n=1 Tax=Brevundimonas diminuta TaxID=293 RepID=UPI0022AEF095|nr:putative entry exclusion protein TrbK-alt [Brevundimonas diminuta]MCZ4107026.1 putative entry exclusion protein TrbK-alt [Brevundimonas diminuta]